MAYRILVADDEKEIRDLLRLYLEKDGYQRRPQMAGKHCLSWNRGRQIWRFWIL